MTVADGAIVGAVGFALGIAGPVRIGQAVGMACSRRMEKTR
jgi:hypothetical protein